MKWVETTNVFECNSVFSFEFWGFDGFELLHLIHMSVHLRICKIILSKRVQVSMASFYQYMRSRGIKLIILAPCLLSNKTSKLL